MDNVFKGSPILGLLFLLIPGLIACAVTESISLDPESKRFPVAGSANTILAKPTKLDFWQTVFIQPEDEKLISFLIDIQFFKQILTLEDLENKIILYDLKDKIPTVRDRIGLSNAHQYYKPFVWLRKKVIKKSGHEYHQLILTNPENMQDFFIAEKKVSKLLWQKSPSTNVLYALNNALLDYIDQYSKDWRPKIPEKMNKFTRQRNTATNKPK